MSEEPSNELPSESEAEKTVDLVEIYENPDYVTLFRYEAPEETYDERREGVVSKREIVGQWFTNNLGDLKTYISMRKPGGNIIAIRVLKSRLAGFNASQKEETKDLDSEEGNYIIPLELANQTKITIPITIETKGVKKFLFTDREKIKEFISDHLSSGALVAHFKGNAQ